MADFWKRFLDWLEQSTDQTLSAEKIRAYVVDRYYFLVYQFTHGRDAEKEDTVRDLFHLHEQMAGLGWVKAPRNPFKLVHKTGLLPSAELLRWKKESRDGRVIRSGIVRTGTGRYLDAMAALEGPQAALFLDQNLERLLRHVETRRKNSLQWFDRRMKEEKRWQERLDIVLLFIHSSARLKDVRYLNAAMKCTDQFFGYFKFKLPGPLLARYLLALVGQETALKELVEK
jgi:hypothetical protein